MDVFVLAGGALGATLRKLMEWAGDRSLATVKGAVVEIVLGAAGALVALKLGLLPDAVTKPMLGDPTGAMVLAIVTAYLPLDVFRRVGDLVSQGGAHAGLLEGRARTSAWQRWR